MLYLPKHYKNVQQVVFFGLHLLRWCHAPNVKEKVWMLLSDVIMIHMSLQLWPKFSGITGRLRKLGIQHAVTLAPDIGDFGALYYKCALFF